MTPEYADNLGRRFALGSYFDGSQAGPFAGGEGGSGRMAGSAGRPDPGFLNLPSSSFADVLASHAPGLLPGLPSGHGTDGLPGSASGQAIRDLPHATTIVAATCDHGVVL